MANSQLGNLIGVTDKRVSPLESNSHSYITSGDTAFTANAAGTTTSIIGADPEPGEGLRIGDKVRLFSGGDPKEDTVFSVDSASTDGVGSTTYVFSPAASEATASGDTVRLVSVDNYQDMDSLDSRLSDLGYSDSNISLMTRNDKIYAIRLEDDSAGI